MHIKRVLIHGFKSYSDTTIFGPFSPGYNVLLGLNGSGKSNFHQAIEFVLLDDISPLRPSDRKNLLHEGSSTASLTAFVEIIFDNKSRTMPIDKDEVSIRRSLGLNKDEYFIDRKHSSRQEIQSLLEASGFSPSNTFYVVRQGMIQSLATMKDNERLDLLMDIAGMKFYDSQKEESLKMLSEAAARNDKIKESIEYIANRLEQLEDEKAELDRFEELEREKRAIEYLIQTEELTSIRTEMDVRKENKEREMEEVKALEKEISEKKDIVKTLENRLKQEQNELKESETKAAFVEAQRSTLIRKITRNELKLQDMLKKQETLGGEDILNVLQETQRKVETLREELKKIDDGLKQKNYEAAQLDGQISSLVKSLGGTPDDPSVLEHQIRKMKEVIESLRESKVGLERELENAGQVKELETEKLDMKAEHKAKKKEKEKLMDKRKELWKVESLREREVRRSSQKLEKLNAKLSGISGGINQALEVAKQFKGVHGAVYELIKCDESILKAVEAVGRSRLFCCVVDNDETAEKVLNEINEKKAGRLSVIPLNRVKPSQEPEGIVSLCSQLQYSNKVKNAIQFVFGRVALCDSLAEATELSSKMKITCVTKDGDLFSSGGTITSGNSGSKSALQLEIQKKLAQNKLLERQEELNETTSQLAEIEDLLRETERSIEEYEEKIRSIDESIRSTHDRRDNLSKKIREVEDSISERETELIKLESRYKAASLETPSKGQLKSLKEQRTLLETMRSSYIVEKNDILSKLNTLENKRKEYQELLSMNIPEAIEELKNSLDNMKETLNSLTTPNMPDVSSDLPQKIEEVNSEIESLQHKLRRHNKVLERESSRLLLLQEKEIETLKQQRELPPPSDTANFEGRTRNELLQTFDDINEESKRYRHVNRKAGEQYRSFSAQREDLLRRQKELEESSDVIQGLISKLDEGKERAIEHTFAQISENFAKIYSELEEGGKAWLSLQRDDEKASGVAIRIEKRGNFMSVAQMSGGQRAMAATAFMLAIQKFAPAPFYLLDEADAAIDIAGREKLAKVVKEACNDGAQFIITTFGREMAEPADKFFAVKYDRGTSTAVEVERDEAMNFFVEKTE